MRGAHRIGTVSAPRDRHARTARAWRSTTAPRALRCPATASTGSTPDIQPGDEIVVRSGAGGRGPHRGRPHHDRRRPASSCPTAISTSTARPSAPTPRATRSRRTRSTPPSSASAASAALRTRSSRRPARAAAGRRSSTRPTTATGRLPQPGQPRADGPAQGGAPRAHPHDGLRPRRGPARRDAAVRGRGGAGPAGRLRGLAGARNAVTSTDDAVIGPLSGDLVVDGTAIGSVLGPTDAARDDAGHRGDRHARRRDPATPAVTKTVALSGGGNEQTWTASFTPAETGGARRRPDQRRRRLHGRGRPAGDLGRPGHDRREGHDEPDVVPDLAPGDHVAPQSVALSAGPGETIHYRTDGRRRRGLPPLHRPDRPRGRDDRDHLVGQGSGGQHLLGLAGVHPDRRRRQPAPTGGSAGAGTAVRRRRRGDARARWSRGAAPAAVPARAVAGIRITGRLRLSAARRLGISVSFLAPRGARVAEVRLIERRNGVRRRLATRTLPVRGGERVVVRLRDASVRRRLAAGRYEVEIRSGPSPAKLGPRTTRTVQLAP